MTSLAARFHDRSHFAPRGPYRLAPFRFTRLDDARYVVTNDVAEYVLLNRAELTALVEKRLDVDSDAYRALKSRHFLFDADSECAIDLLALKYRSRADPIANFTGLHLFVVTLRCDHSCHYCQVSRQVEDKTAFDMTKTDADRALDFTFQTPSKQIKIEFQGGESLLNFDLIRYIVLEAEQRALRMDRDVQFVIATNLARLTDEILDFCKHHTIYLSTSLDGPEDVHNAHRQVKGQNSYELTIDGIRRARAALGSNAVSALMTTTPASLDRVEDIINEYVQQGFRSIFLRSLSPYGFAIRTSLIRKYGIDDWLEFYRRGLAHVLELNRNGTFFHEEFTTILLQKLFSPTGPRYVDLQSPAGIGIGGIVFNYDGAVYASDEGRMLAEMGDTTFRLGSLQSDTYESMMTSEKLLAPLEDSLPESAPMCSDCAFLPMCGAEPVFHQATVGESLGHKVFSAFCKKQMGALRHIITLLEGDPEARRILLGWI